MFGNVYTLLAERETGRGVGWVAVSLVIFAFVVVYGVAATPFTKLYGNRAEQRGAVGERDQRFTKREPTNNIILN